MVETTCTDNARVISLFPNRSASWAQTRLLIFLICGTCLAIGIFWSFIGAWMILPFAGLEAGLVAYLLYRVSRSTYRRQVISVTPSIVQVQFGHRFPTRSWELKRDDTRLAVIAPERPLDSIRIKISDHRHSLELGAFLNADDMHEAFRELKKSGLRVQQSQPLQSSF